MSKKELKFNYWSAATSFSAFQLMTTIPEPQGAYCYDPKTKQIVSSLKAFIEQWQKLKPALGFNLTLGNELFMQKLFTEELFAEPWGRALLHSGSVEFGNGVLLKIPDFLLPTQCLYCGAEMQFRDSDIYAPRHEAKLTCDDTHKKYWGKYLKQYFKKPIEDLCKAPVPNCPEQNIENLQKVAKATFDS